jgi:uncharacterized protein YcbX
MQASVRELWRYPVKSMAGERLDASDVGSNGFLSDRAWAVVDAKSGEIHNAKRFPRLMQCAAVSRGQHVDITFPDGTTISSDSPELAAKLSELMGHAVTLEPLRPASDRAFYRRRDPGSSVIGKIARSRKVRGMIGWAANRGLVGGDIRAEFGREKEESLPDMRDVPAEVFEYYTPPGTFFDVFPIHVLTTSALALMRQLNPNSDWDVRRFRPNVVIDTGTDAEQTEAQWIGRTVRIGTFAIRGEIMTMRCAMPIHPQRELPQDPSILRTIVREADHCLGLYASVAEPGRVTVGDEVRY